MFLSERKMFWVYEGLFKNGKTLAGRGLLFVLLILPAIVMIVVWKQNEENIVATKREQKLQIDLAFVIHGSKNITSPARVKTYKEALKWAKKIIKAFGEVGINKTRVGLVLFAEKPKLMFNFTEKLTKGDVLGAVDEAEQPPVLGNQTFTGKALWLTLSTLAKGVRKAAVKKFFVFSDRPPEDAPLPPALAMLKKGVDIYGLGQTTAPYSDWYIHDFDMDNMYSMMAAGPFKWKNVGADDLDEAQSSNDVHTTENTTTAYEDTNFQKEPQGFVQEPSEEKNNQEVNVTNPRPSNQDKVSQDLPENTTQDISNQKQQDGINPSGNPDATIANVIPQGTTTDHEDINLTPKDTKFQKELQKITYSADHVPEPSNKKINQVVTVTNPTPINQDEVSESKILPENTTQYISNGKQQDEINVSSNPSETTIASVISQKVTRINPIRLGTNHYGNDASVVITANPVTSGNSGIGRYSANDEGGQFSPTDFGTVIGGMHKESRPQFSVIKPSEQDSTLRSKVRDDNKQTDQL